MAVDKEEVTALSAFNCTVSEYQEMAYASNGLEAMEYGQGSEAGKATNTGSSATVKPSNSDFVCEIENAARRGLSVREYAYFKMYYKQALVVVEDVSGADRDECLQAHQDTFSNRSDMAALDLSMRTKLGNRLISVGLYPSSEYFKPVDLRAKKPRKQKWSHLYGN